MQLCFDVFKKAIIELTLKVPCDFDLSLPRCPTLRDILHNWDEIDRRMCTGLLQSRGFKRDLWKMSFVRTMSSSQWCSASKNALTSGVVIRGARFPYNTERITEVEKRRIESKKSWATIKEGYFGEGGKERSSYIRVCQHFVHQLGCLSMLNLQVISARRLCQNFTCTSPKAAPLFIWRQ